MKGSNDKDNKKNTVNDKHNVLKQNHIQVNDQLKRKFSNITNPIEPKTLANEISKLMDSTDLSIQIMQKKSDLLQNAKKRSQTEEIKLQNKSQETL